LPGAELILRCDSRGRGNGGVRHKAASSHGDRAALDPARSKPQRQAADTGDANAEPLHAAKQRPGSAAARLAVEVERLSAELAASRQRIGELENRIDVDPLTQTFNRRGFERTLARSLAYVKRYQAAAALVYLDLDAFKPVNDRHGHAAGDAVLKAVSAALQREVRASDIVARIGGDEFVILLWNMTEADARDKAALWKRQCTQRRCGGARPPWRSAPQRASLLSVRSTRLPRRSHAPIPPCTPARCSASKATLPRLSRKRAKRT
jgi:diguanylate cyclase (GGDEF)-like protein